MSAPGRLRIDDQLCFALYAATTAITRAYRPLLRNLGITYPQYLALMVLWQDGDSSVNRIAARLNLPGHAVTPLLVRLEVAGLVERHRDPRDGRSVRVHLTQPGLELEQAAAKVQRTVACQTGLSPDALAELRADLHHLVEDMTHPNGNPIQNEGEAS